jgi:formylglycine-generating enzyme required for sulfatase activity
MKKVENPLVLMEKGTTRIFRGGGWGSKVRWCRAACRYGFVASVRYDDLGFRPILRPLRIKSNEEG